ncbi:MAG: bifunctional adenosylcobinamide kinase/adenosylcobinamide-phosphate guanylyltransferase [Candidatus Omnitrophota bacterium]
MNKITFILGGSRSGKSRLAVKLAKQKNQKVAFIATCQPLDEEMRQRIKAHQKNRPKNWKTFEEPINIAAQIHKIGDTFDVILIDCLTLWISNLLLMKFHEAKIKNEIKKILSALRKTRANSIIVSNEVGLSIVPTNKLARDFRDIAGTINQIVAQKADYVTFMMAGIPMEIKK